MSVEFFCDVVDSGRRERLLEGFNRHVVALQSKEGKRALTRGAEKALIHWLADTFPDGGAALRPFTVPQQTKEGETVLRIHPGKLGAAIPPEVAAELTLAGLSPVAVILGAIKELVVARSTGGAESTKIERDAIWLSWCDEEQVGPAKMGGVKSGKMGRRGKALAESWSRTPTPIRG